MKPLARLGAIAIVAALAGCEKLTQPVTQQRTPLQPLFSVAVANRTDLGTLPGDELSVAFGTNNLGQIVGLSGGTGSRAFLWSPTSFGATSGTMVELVTPPGWTDSQANATNDLGQIVGWGGPPLAPPHAVLWTTSAAGGISVRDLGTLDNPGSPSPGDYSRANAINVAGQVVGSSSLMLGAVHAFLWTSSTGMKDLGELHFGSEAFAINNLGWVVGGSHNSSGQGRAFLWTPSAAGAVSGAMRDLGILPGGDYSVASGVNDAGQIVGMSTTAQGSAHAVLWAISATGNVSIQDLGELPGATHAAALAINDLGQVVGRGDWVGDQSYAFFWTAQDGMIELSPSAAGCSSDLCAEALALNNLGTVVGAAWAGSGAHATRWTVRVIPPTPVEQIQTIETQVQALLSSGVVNGGQGNALIAKLDAATAQINKGNTKAAVNVLQAFINQCLALVNAGTLTAQQAQPLIDAATALIQRLSSTP